MSKTVDHYEVPADGQRHEFQLSWPPKILLVGCREDDVIEFWATNAVGPSTQRVQLIAYATGQAVPDYSDHRGSCVAPNGTEWHLFEEFDEESAGRGAAADVAEGDRWSPVDRTTTEDDSTRHTQSAEQGRHSQPEPEQDQENVRSGVYTDTPRVTS